MEREIKELEDEAQRARAANRKQRATSKADARTPVVRGSEGAGAISAIAKSADKALKTAGKNSPNIPHEPSSAGGQQQNAAGLRLKSPPPAAWPESSDDSSGAQWHGGLRCVRGLLRKCVRTKGGHS